MTNDVRVERLARDQYPALKLKEDAHVMVVLSQAHAQNPAANYLQRVFVPPTPEWLHFTDSRSGAPPI
jgi:hypothetical protein